MHARRTCFACAVCIDGGEYGMVAWHTVHGYVVYTYEHSLAMQWLHSSYCAMCDEVDDLDPPLLLEARVLGLPHDIPYE